MMQYIQQIDSCYAYPRTYPISSRWVLDMLRALTFLHSVLWIKAQGRLVLNCCLNGLMEVSSFALCRYQHERIVYQAAVCSWLLRIVPKTFSGWYCSFFFVSMKIIVSIFLLMTTIACSFLRGFFSRVRR